MLPAFFSGFSIHFCKYIPMNISQFPLVLAILFVSVSSFAQSSIDFQDDVAFRETEPSMPASPSPYRFHKKLPGMYDGYAIEVARSTYPLDRANPIFRQFGNVHYDKLEQGGYSYLILGRFSGDDSGLRFLDNIIRPKAKEAKLVHYQDGIRKIVRAD